MGFAKYLAWVVAGALSVFAVSVFAFNQYLEAEFMQSFREDVARIDAVIPRMEADLKLLASKPPFPNETRKKNASEFLSEHVGWDSGVAHNDLVAIQDLLAKSPHWSEDPKKIKDLSLSSELDALDTKWLEEISKFDHWNLTENHRIKEIANKAANENGIARIGLFGQIPVPGYSRLRLAAIVYFLKTYRGGDPEAGLKVLRKLAELSHSSGNLVGQMMSTTFLKMENQLAATLKLSEYPVVPMEIIEAYKRVSWSWAGILTLAWVKGIDTRLEKFMNRAHGVCAGAWESTLTLEGLKDLLEPQFPFEKSFAIEFSRQREIQDRLTKLCDLQVFLPFRAVVPDDKKKWFQTNSVEMVSLSGSGEVPAQTYFTPARFPFVRRYVALVMLKIASPNFMKYYETDAQN